KFLCQLDLGFRFQQGTSCMAKKLTEFTRRQATLSFSNVARDRQSRTPQLASQTVKFLSWEILRCGVNIANKIHCLLPSNQISVRLSHSVLRCSGPNCKP